MPWRWSRPGPLSRRPSGTSSGRAGRRRPGSNGSSAAALDLELRRGTPAASSSESPASSASILPADGDGLLPSSFASSNSRWTPGPGSRDLLLVDVGDVEHRLGRQHEALAGQLQFGRAGGEGRAGLPVLQGRTQALGGDELGRIFGSLRASLVELLAPASPAWRGRRAPSRWRRSRRRAPGRVAPSTWMTSASSKQRTTIASASASRMWLRNALPRPAPELDRGRGRRYRRSASSHGRCVRSRRSPPERAGGRREPARRRRSARSSQKGNWRRRAPRTE